MTASRPKFYLTTAIDYPNGRPHVGHAYEKIAADALVRFKRLDGHDVHFVTGTDEHGLKMLQTAARENLTPQELTDRNSAVFKEMDALFGVSYDDFIRTTEPRHHRSVQEIWRRMEKAGDIYKSSYAGWYSVRDEAYYTEAETEIGPDGVRRSTGTQTPVEWTEEDSYFFRLSAYQDRLLAHYEANPDFIGPTARKNEVISFVKGGLEDLSVSRTTFDWGIPVPDAPGHVMYVWVDALTNYISATGFPDEASETYKKWWPADVHIIGKDIIRFHAVYWPAFLMAADLAPPKRVFAHGWWTIEGQKMSKSLGNVIAPDALVNTYGLDQTRYFLLREVPFGNDGDFSHKQMVARINGNLANDYGNLVQRVLSMIGKNCGGVVPTPGPFTEADNALLGAAHGLLDTVRAEFDAQAFHKALDALWAVIGDGNRYVDEQAPWTLKKTDPARMATVLYVLAETIRHLAILTQAVMPDASAKILDQLALGPDARGFGSLGPAGALVAGTPLPTPQGVFPRFVEPTAE